MLVIIPFAHALFLDNCRDNIARQRNAEFSVVVVENAGGVGKWRGSGGVPVLRSLPGKSAALTEGIAFARQHGHAMWRIFDQDDWYGRDAVSMMMAQLREHDIVTSLPRWFREDDGNLWCLNADQRERPCRIEDANFIWGGCIGARTSVATPWHSCEPAESHTWIADSVAVGYDVQLIKARECWVRHAGHTHAAPDIRGGMAMRNKWPGRARHFGVVPLDTVDTDDGRGGVSKKARPAPVEMTERLMARIALRSSTTPS